MWDFDGKYLSEDLNALDLDFNAAIEKHMDGNVIQNNCDTNMLESLGFKHIEFIDQAILNREKKIVILTSSKGSYERYGRIWDLSDFYKIKEFVKEKSSLNQILLLTSIEKATKNNKRFELNSQSQALFHQMPTNIQNVVKTYVSEKKQ